MAVDRKYGRVTAEKGDVQHGELFGVPLNDSDEPCFVIRAQDALSPGAVRDYERRAYRAGLDEVAKGAAAAAEAIEAWQSEHPDRVKKPD